MNKAFVREPDDTGQLHCPACGSLGIAVERETWQAHVKPEAADAPGRIGVLLPVRPVRRGVLRHVRAARHDRRRAARRLSQGSASADLRLLWPDRRGRRGRYSRRRADARPRGVAKAKSDDAHCRTMSPSGQSCVAEVQRYYMKLRQAGVIFGMPAAIFRPFLGSRRFAVYNRQKWSQRPTNLTLCRSGGIRCRGRCG